MRSNGQAFKPTREPRALPKQYLFASKDGLPTHGARNTTGADANPLAQPFARTAENSCDSSGGLFVVLYELPVRIHLEARLFTVRFDEHLVIPLTIGIIFP